VVSGRLRGPGPLEYSILAEGGALCPEGLTVSFDVCILNSIHSALSPEVDLLAELTVQQEVEEPVYRQVARQIRDKIVYGELAPGHRLPSVRALASDLGVNLNTVARAYRTLEQEGFVSIVGRSKVEVAPPGEGATGANERPPSQLLAALRESLARLRQSGLAPGELRKIVGKEIDSMYTAMKEH
jgi:DNA-binding transcriptional regulator YhcF (GntR family)